MLGLAGTLALLVSDVQPAPASPVASSNEIRPYLLAISVPDANASADWYAAKLGFQVVRRGNYPEHGLRIIFLERDHFRLELVENGKSFAIEKHVPGYQPMSGLLQGFAKIAFQVKDAATLADELKRKGVQFAVPLKTDAVTRTRHFIIEDLNGNLVQFIEPLE